MGKLWILAAGLLLAPASGQEREPSRSSDPVALQRIARERFDRLTETLSRLAVEIKEREPERSELLQAALRFLGEKALADRMEGIRGALEGRRWQEALDGMAKVEADLSTLLELLLSRDRELLELLKEIERLEGLRREVERLIEEQEKERTRAAAAAALQAHLARLEQAAALLADLERRERELGARNAAGGEAGELAGSQRELARETDEAAKRLDRLAEDQERLAGTRTDAAPQAARRAGEAMGKADAALQGGDRPGAGEAMAGAASELARARQALEEMARQAKARLDELDLAGQARAQEDTAKSTSDLAERMKQPAGEGGKAAPGGGNLGQAVPHQQNAGGALGQGRPGGAVPEQDQALDKMKGAKDELERALEQARRKLQEELLQALEERLAAMLAAQRRISGETRVLHQQAGGEEPPPRPVRLKAARLAGEERHLGDDADQALRLLREEGSTVVIPEILEAVKEDLLGLGEALAAARVGPDTQAVQEEVEALLAAILEAIRREQDEREQQDGRQQPQDDQDRPLVPRSAELRMIRILQNGVYLATLKAKLQVERDLDAARRMAEGLAPREARIHELTRRLAERIDKDLAGREEGR